MQGKDNQSAGPGTSVTRGLCVFAKKDLRKQEFTWCPDERAPQQA